MEILELINNELVISPQAIDLIFFNNLWVKDKSKDKSSATKDIKYIFYMINFKSPFFKYPPSQREGLIKSELVGFSNYKPSKETLEAMESYRSYYYKSFPEISLFESVLISLDNMQQYFKGLNYKEFTPMDLIKIQESVIRMPKLQESVQLALDNCKKGQSGSNRARGDYKPGLFEN